MGKRFIVKNVVCDYGVFDTLMPEAEQLDCICSARANADLIADILNTDYSKPNECTYYENELQQENKQLKEQEHLKDEALYWACNYITRIVDKDVNKLPHEWARHFIEQAKESMK